MTAGPVGKTVGPACRLTVFVAEAHRRGQRYAVTRFLERAAEMGCPGGTVFQGLAGFGRTGHQHASHLLHAPDKMPLSVVVVDRRDRISALLPVLDELLPGAVAFLDDVRTIRYVGPHHHHKHRDDRHRNR